MDDKKTTDKPITNGAELVLRLRESGTGETKLAVARLALVEFGDGCTAQHVIERLKKHPDEVPGQTVMKAEQLARMGRIEETVTTKFELEDLLAQAAGVEPAPKPAPGTKPGQKGLTAEDVLAIVKASQPTPEQIATVVAQATAKTLAEFTAKDREEREAAMKATIQSGRDHAEKLNAAEKDKPPVVTSVTNPPAPAKESDEPSSAEKPVSPPPPPTPAKAPPKK